MRYPLRYQIIAPLMAVLLLTVAALVLWQGIALSERTTNQVELRLRGVVRTLAESNFPLTRPVLEQMKGLSGAEFLLVDGDRTVATSGLQGRAKDFTNGVLAGNWRDIVLDHRVTLDGQVFFHALVVLPRRQGGSSQPRLHLFYAQDEFRRAWREAVAPPLLMGGLAIVATGLCGCWVARRISQTATKITWHVGLIAQGDFRPLPVPSQEDELSDLVRDINTMAEQLQLYEARIRRAEQGKILEQLGTGLAHEIRNAVTGSRLALQIHAGECPLEKCESMEVASRQLQIMENRLQRYLQLSKRHNRAAPNPVDLANLLDRLLPLMQPLADHLQVGLQWNRPGGPMRVMAQREALEQVFLNLLQNAIEAAAARHGPSSVPRRVQMTLSCLAENSLQVRFSDSGAGPSPLVQERLFERFVSDKANGAGLGLSVARGIVLEHGGSLSWNRVGSQTVFVVDLPAISPEVRDGANSCGG